MCKAFAIATVVALFAPSVPASHKLLRSLREAPMRRCFLRAALSHNWTLAADCRKLVSTRTSWAIKAKAIASVFAKASSPKWIRRYGPYR